METFLLDYCPSEALRREVRRRGLTIVGHLGTYEHPKHPGDLAWRMTPFMVDENPVWALDVCGGTEVIWECDRPAFNAKLREYGKRPDQIRRTSLMTAIKVASYDAEGKFISTTRDAWVIASILGRVDGNGNWTHSIGVPNLFIVGAMIKLARERDAKPYALPFDITLNHGILRFLEAARSLPDRLDRGVLDQLRLQLATEPTVLLINPQHLGSDATAAEARAMVQVLVQGGCSAELGSPLARHPTEAGLSRTMWRHFLKKVQGLRLSV